jgi:hypothetical protein
MAKPRPVPIPDPAPEPAPEAAEIAAGFRAVFRLFELWKLDVEQQRVLLGRPPRSTFYNWRAGKIGTVPHDVVRRLSWLLGIHKALQIVFADPAQADGWVHRANDAFGGRSALDHMLGGDVADLAAVRARLDAARGGWS